MKKKKGMAMPKMPKMGALGSSKSGGKSGGKAPTIKKVKY
jgi:hypothetical protein